MRKEILVDRYADGISDRVQCLLRQVIMMTKFSEAFNLCQNKFVEEGYKGVGTIYQSKSYVEWIMISISKINATTVVKGMGMIIWFMKKIKGNETNKNHTHRKTTDFLWNY